METINPITPIRIAVPKCPPTPENDRLFANMIVLEVESKEAFLKLVARLRDEYLPADIIEHSYVEALAVAQWRQQQMDTLIRAILEREINAHEDPDGATRKPLFASLERFQRMKRSHAREARRNIAMLKDLKAHRRAEMSGESKCKTK